MIFSKSYCPYCQRTKQLFEDTGKPFKVLELDLDPIGSEYQAALQQLTGQRTVPNVFIAGKHIGGHDSTMAAKKDGTLDKLLNPKQEL